MTAGFTNYLGTLDLESIGRDKSMISVTEELREVTKYVLYGWGYPELFSTSEGQPLQNRVVRFPLREAPAIEGVNQAAFRSVFPKLELVKEKYLNTIVQKTSGINPVWVWVDMPKSLTEEEILEYQQRFMVWATREGIAERSVSQVAPIAWKDKIYSLLQQPIAQVQTQIQAISPRWQQIALTIGLVVVLLLSYLLTPTSAACSPENSIAGEQCVDAIVATPDSTEPLDAQSSSDYQLDNLSDLLTDRSSISNANISEIMNLSF